MQGRKYQRRNIWFHSPVVGAFDAKRRRDGLERLPVEFKERLVSMIWSYEMMSMYFDVFDCASSSTAAARHAARRSQAGVYSCIPAHTNFHALHMSSHALPLFIGARYKIMQPSGTLPTISAMYIGILYPSASIGSDRIATCSPTATSPTPNWAVLTASYCRSCSSRWSVLWLPPEFLYWINSTWDLSGTWDDGRDFQLHENRLWITRLVYS